MAYAIDVVEVQPTTLASVRQRVERASIWEAIPALLGEVVDVLKASRCQTTGLKVSQYRDPGRTDIEIECGLEVTGTFEGTERVRRSSTPGGKVLHLLHVGSHGRLVYAWEALQSYRRAHGYVEDVLWEVYGDWKLEESRLRTDVYGLAREIQ
jgi:effector-binding domain-containing protein